MASFLDTEDNKTFSRPKGSALSVEGKVIKLKSMFSELIKKLDTGPSSSRENSGLVIFRDQRGKLVVGTLAVQNFIDWDCPKPKKNKADKNSGNLGNRKRD